MLVIYDAGSDLPGRCLLLHRGMFVTGFEAHASPHQTSSALIAPHSRRLLRWAPLACVESGSHHLSAAAFVVPR